MTMDADTEKNLKECHKLAIALLEECVGKIGALQIKTVLGDPAARDLFNFADKKLDPAAIAKLNEYDPIPF